MQQSLVKYIEELKDTTAEKASIERDLRIASSIQMGMLPENFPTKAEREDVQLFASLTPAKEVGGDLFDFYFRGNKLFFCIGDVSGKGVPASLFMAVTRSVFRTVSAHESKPDRIMSTINTTIADMNKTIAMLDTMHRCLSEPVLANCPVTPTFLSVSCRRGSILYRRHSFMKIPPFSSLPTD